MTEGTKLPAATTAGTSGEASTSEPPKAAKPKAAKKIKCVVIRDLWDDDGTRHVAGSTIELEAEAVMDAVESGVVARYKAPAK